MRLVEVIRRREVQGQSQQEDGESSCVPMHVLVGRPGAPDYSNEEERWDTPAASEEVASRKKPRYRTAALSPAHIQWWFAPARRIPLIAVAVVLLDQLTKYAAASAQPFNSERVVLDGFFKLVHWGNTGSAFSMFQNSNTILAVVSVAAVVILYLTRHHFDADRPAGQIALGLIFGGIFGNLIDRLLHNHVIDFIYFYVTRRDDTELGFPAFNIADSAICVGVGLLFVLAWLSPEKPAVPSSSR